MRNTVGEREETYEYQRENHDRCGGVVGHTHTVGEESKNQAPGDEPDRQAEERR